MVQQATQLVSHQQDGQAFHNLVREGLPTRESTRFRIHKRVSQYQLSETSPLVLRRGEVSAIGSIITDVFILFSSHAN